MRNSFLGFVILVAFASNSECRKFQDDTSLLTSKSEVLNQFKELVVPSLSKDYMKSEAFLLRWLKASDYDPVKAVKNVANFLEWREKNGFDNWIADEWVENNLPIKMFDDKEGMPVLWFQFSSWDLRQASRMGKMEKFLSFFMKTFDTAMETVYSRQAKGKNITRFSGIANLNGFNYEDHLCPYCLPFYFNAVLSISAYYPKIIDQSVLIHTPSIFKPLVTLTDPIMEEDFRTSLKVFSAGEGRSAMEAYLEDWVGIENIPTPNNL